MFPRHVCRRGAAATARRRLTRGVLVAATLILSGTIAQTANPSSGTLSPTKGASVSWVGTAPGGVSPGPQFDDHDGFCVDGITCEHFELTLTGTPADWSGLKVRIGVQWGSVTSDYDIYVHRGSPGGVIVDHSATGPTNFEQVEIDPAEVIDPETGDKVGTGKFYVHVVYFAATAADPYRATARVVPTGSALPPAPIDQGPTPQYQTHTPTAEQIAAGMSRNVQDEPNIGVNWKTGNVMLQALLQTLRVKFDDDVCPQTPTSTWEHKSPVTAVNSFDPILFTDHETNRTFVSHLLLNPLASISAVTDDDGELWIPSQGAGVGSGIDHQTIGGGPFHAPAPPSVGYKNAVYYCAQDIAFANCALSVDGGLTYGPAIPMYSLNQCSGLHGHVKVGPDGTVYVPNALCIGVKNPIENAVVVSENNGVTWDVRTVPGSLSGGGSDPSVAVDTGGRLYLGFVDDDKNPAVAVSADKGLTWEYVYDVGAMVGVTHAVFPAMVAGGPGRAAVAFYGTRGGSGVNSFNGDAMWHLYVAHTYDGGASWITVNATPNDPLQRGGLHLGGGSHIHRNLLDFFDADLDAQGRMVIGYADGCLGACAQAADTSRGNSYTAYGTIARQTGGRRLVAEFDAPGATVPGAPRLTVTRNGSLATLTWSQSETGGSPITAYRIFRREGAGAETLIASLGGTTTRFVDRSGDPRVTYTYGVAARNAVGESCGTNAVEAPPAGSSCAAPGVRVVQDALNDQRGAPLNTDMDIEWIAIGEPFFEDGSQKLVFTMKVAGLSTPLPPDRMWRVLWFHPDAPQPPNPTSTSFVGRYYIGMNSNETGGASFEYGIVRSLSAVVADVLPTTRLGDAPGSTFNNDGTITLVIDTAKVGGVEAGDLIGGLIGRTYPVRQNQTLRGESAADSVVFSSTYALVGNAFCKNPPPTVNCFSESDARVSYGKGWHTVNDPDAEGGRFRVKPGNGAQGLSFPLSVPEGADGAVVYHYATSTKGGSADVYIDGAFRETISYAGDSGSLNDPVFGSNSRFGGLAPGAQTFELRNVSGAAYADRFCLESAFFTSSSTTGPSETTASVKTVDASNSLLQAVLVPAGAQAIAVVASAPGSAVLQLVLIDPAGAVLESVTGANGVAVLERDVSQSGSYQVKVVNAGLAAADVWVATTSWGPR